MAADVDGGPVSALSLIGGEPVPALLIALTLGVYLSGWRTLARYRRAAGRRPPAWRHACFLAGLAVLWLTLCSPLHELGRALFAAHMTQHELLMLVAAPLLALGEPLGPLLLGLPARWSRSVAAPARTNAWRAAWSFVTAPAVAWSINALALWVWHDPVLFQATLTSEAMHAAQHVSFLGASLLFWWALLHGEAAKGRAGAGVLYVFTTLLHTTLLGALLTFAARPWYPAYAATTGAHGLTALEDQQIGGLIMWVPAGLVYIGAGLALFAAWLRESERRATLNDALLQGGRP